MAKAKAKKINDKKFHNENYKTYTKATIYTIQEHIQDIDFEELVTGIYLHTDDEDVKYLLKSIEKQLLLCKIDFEKFSSGLHNYYVSMAEEIKEKKLYKKFYKLSYYIYAAMNDRDTKQAVFGIYHNFVMQLNAYFPKNTKKTPVGVTSKGELMIRDEAIPNLTDINYELPFDRVAKSREQEVLKVYHKYGHKEVSNAMDMVKLAVNEQLITNMLYSMSYFIHEHNEHMIAKPYFMPNSRLLFSPHLRSSLNPATKYALTQLASREYMLPTEGVVVKLNNASNIDEILMEETVVDDNIILLYRLKFEGGYLGGYFDTKRELFYSPWKDSDYKENYSEPLKCIILQAYMYLTCGLTKEAIEEHYLLNLLGVTYDIKVIDRTSKRERVRYEPYDRSKYLAELIDIQPFLRHLPIGAVASDEAQALARKLGITLPKGMTLVRGFRRKSWVKE